MIVDELPQDSLEETEAIEYAGEYLSWVFFEARDRAKGKGSKASMARAKALGKERARKEVLARSLCHQAPSASTAPTWNTGEHYKMLGKAADSTDMMTNDRNSPWSSFRPSQGAMPVGKWAIGPAIVH